jgi:hypothetical protein
MQRAEHAQSQLRDEQASRVRGPDADQALIRLLTVTVSRTAGLPPPRAVNMPVCMPRRRSARPALSSGVTVNGQLAGARTR